MERLDKFLVSQNMGSRKDVGILVRKGAVLVNGAAALKADQKINPEKDVVTVSGKDIVYRKHLYIMMNKPEGVLSATEDKRQKTVLDLLPEELRRRNLFPAGRLDKNTTGLLIITDDGDFAHQMLAPKKHVYKQYLAQLEGPVTEEMIREFERGISFGGIQFSPARLWTQENRTQAYVEIHEGKFHQIKRMFEAVGNPVRSLKRLKIGGLHLDDTLQEGESRLLDSSEIIQIFHGNLY